MDGVNRIQMLLAPATSFRLHSRPYSPALSYYHNY